MPVRIVVRDARPSEYAAVADVTVRGYLGDGFGDERYGRELADVAGRARNAEILVATLAGGGHEGGPVVARQGGPVVGALALAFWPSPVAEVGREGEAVFRMLAVDPSARRQGVGEALVRECVRRAHERGCSAIVLSTMPGMSAAHRLYERLGFRRMPERDWSPHPGVDLIVYGLPLP